MQRKRIAACAIMPVAKRPTIQIPVAWDLDVVPIRPMWAKRFSHEETNDGNIDVLLDSLPYVCVRDSSIPDSGKGLYANRAFSKGDIVGVYAGKIIGWTKNRTVTEQGSPYIVDMPLYRDKDGANDYDILVDGGSVTQSHYDIRSLLGLSIHHPIPFVAEEWPGMYAHMMNDAGGPCRIEGIVNNCKLTEHGLVQATRYIPGCPPHNPSPTSELLMSYGPTYWHD